MQNEKIIFFCFFSHCLFLNFKVFGVDISYWLLSCYCVMENQQQDKKLSNFVLFQKNIYKELMFKCWNHFRLQQKTVIGNSRGMSQGVHFKHCILWAIWMVPPLGRVWLNTVLEQQNCQPAVEHAGHCMSCTGNWDPWPRASSRWCQEREVGPESLSLTLLPSPSLSENVVWDSTAPEPAKLSVVVVEAPGTTLPWGYSPWAVSLGKCSVNKLEMELWTWSHRIVLVGKDLEDHQLQL